MSHIPSTRPARDSPTNEPDYYRDLLFDCFEALRSANQEQEQDLLRMIRHHTPLQEIRVYLDGLLPDVQNDQVPHRNKKIKYDISAQNDIPKFRPQIMDIRYLCGSAPYKVPARPWTNVTHDDDLVSHLISLYMTWDYPFFAFFDRETFLDHMAKGHMNSDFCSPFLVNALLANACVSVIHPATIVGDVLKQSCRTIRNILRHIPSQETSRQKARISLQKRSDI